MAKNDILSIIEKPVGSMKIILYLHHNQKVTITSILKNKKLNQRTTYSALKKLRKEGLISCKQGRGFPVCKYYLLTDKGKNLALLLNRVATL